MRSRRSENEWDKNRTGLPANHVCIFPAPCIGDCSVCSSLLGLSDALETGMAAIVVCWLCKCGTRLKAIAEADFNPASATNSCTMSKIAATRSLYTPIRLFLYRRISPRVRQPPVRKRNVCWLLGIRHSTSTGGEALKLAEAAGRIAHAEFEFLANRVRNARQAFLETAEQLNEHTAHGC